MSSGDRTRDSFPLLALRASDERAVIPRILAGELGGVVVADALTPGLCADWTARLDAGDVPVEPTRFAAEFEAFSYGPCLDQSEGDLGRYLSRAGPFEALLEANSGALSLSDTLLRALTRLAGGAEVRRPSSADGRQYGLCTLRRLPPGGRIPPHCENEQLPRASYRELRGELDATTLLSFYVTLRPADEGGELAVHALGVDAIAGRTKDGHSDIAHEVERSPRVSVRPGPGELLVFDGGRSFHQVCEVRGARARWTLGGFLAPSRVPGVLYAWS